jgi:DNA primase
MASRPAYTDQPRASQPGRRSGGGFALLSPAFLDELRARTSLSGLIGRSVKLTKAGNEWKACCPFHQEKSPSFYVNDDKQFYHCFGCGAHGDAIRFLTDARGLEFLDAVKELAAAAGLELPTPDPATREKAERAAGLHEVMAKAAAWFRAQLGGVGGSAARAYLDKRAFTPTTQAEFGFGHAPDGRRNLADALADIPTKMLIEAGLLIQPEGDGQPYDRFRGRLMIPIADQRGRIIAFGGRILGDGEPKYLNSPETSLFDKGSTLYNLHRAAPATRKSGRLVIVEGYLDVVAVAQAGMAEVVAPLGTALTERQMERCWSLVDSPILCFDGDKAGQKAALRAAERAMPALRPGKGLLFAILPQGMDPDDLIKFGGLAEFDKALASPRSMVELLYQHELGDGDMTRPELRAGLRDRLEKLAETCLDRVVKEEFRRALNDRFYEDFGWKKHDRRTITSDVLSTPVERIAPDSYHLRRSALFGLTRFPEVLREHAEQLLHVNWRHTRRARWRDTLVGAVMRGDTLHGEGQTAVTASDGLAEILNWNIQRDLRFGFARSDVPPARQAEILGGLVRFLCDERELDEGLSGLDRAAVSAATNDEYLAIEAERQYLRDQRASLFDWAYQLGADEQDHGTHNGED